MLLLHLEVFCCNVLIKPYFTLLQNAAFQHKAEGGALLKKNHSRKWLKIKHEKYEK